MDFNSQWKWNLAWRMEGRSTWREYRNKFSFIAGQVLEHRRAPGTPVRVLDCGAGVGILLSKIHEVIPLAKLFACDFSEVALSLLPDYVEGKKAILPDLPYEDASFDVAIGTEILEHLLEDRKLVEEMFRVCKPGGRIIVSVPNDILGSEVEPEHKRQYNEESLKSLFKGLVGEIELAIVPEIYTYANSFLVAIATRPGAEIVRRELTDRSLQAGTVFIAVPHNKGVCRVELCNWLIAQALAGKLRHFPFFEGRPSDKNRNSICKHFLQERKEDYLLMVDTGVIPPSNILDLASFGLDVVSGLCFSWQENIPFALVLEEVEGGFKQSKEIPSNSLLQKDAFGTGCILIRRKVIETVPPPWFEFEGDEWGMLKCGEDFSFLKKVRSYGFRAYVHTGYMCSHFGEIDILQVNNLLVKAQQDAIAQGGVAVVQKLLGMIKDGKTLEELMPILENSLREATA